VRWQEEFGADAVPAPELFRKVLFATRRYLADPDKLVRKGSSRACDVLAVGQYERAVVGTLFDAIRTTEEGEARELPVIPQGAGGRGSTESVDFPSYKPIYAVEKCHLNAMVADTDKWEQSAAFALDKHSAVARWVKNDHLGFLIPYRKRGIPAKYAPDFIAVLDTGLQLIVEIKGQYGDSADLKAKAAMRWVDAMNNLGDYGQWAYEVVRDPQSLAQLLDRYAEGPSGNSQLELSGDITPLRQIPVSCL
jgi:type III restriction enzyme